MDSREKHEMVCGGRLPSGAEEWFRPICGRRTLIDWEPAFKRTVLEVGDSFALHSAVKGELPPVESSQSGTTELPYSEEPTHPEAEEHRLAPWRAWLDRSDFENLWNDEL